MLEEADPLVTPDTRKRTREESSPSIDSSPSLSPPPPLKRMTTEFVNNLLTALGDERICNRLGDIISASLRQKVEDQEKSIQVLEQKVAELENKQRIQDAKPDEQEMYSRRENVRIWTGEKENEDENTDTIILKLATKMQVPLKVEDSSRSHRVGRPGTGKHQAIICRFLSWRIKRQFMKSRPALKDSKVLVSDDLTRAWSHLYYLASQKQVQSKCFQCWAIDGNVFLKKAENAAPILVKDSEHIDSVCP